MTRRRRLSRALWRRAMDSDDGRIWLATAPAVLIVLGLRMLAPGIWPAIEDTAGVRRLFYATTSATVALMYLGFIVLTLARFGKRTARELERDLRTVSRGARADVWTTRWGLTYGSTLGWTTSVSVLALLLVIVVMLDPASRGDVGLRVLCAGVVATSWAVLLVSQALAYARIAAQEGGIAFAGSPEPVFGDFLALATFVSAMFGTGDATLSGRRARRAMQEHVLVGFAFNSMLVASLATLLLSTG